jgi:hypothetical protein
MRHSSAYGQALHISFVTVRAAGTQLLVRAQNEGTARNDMDGTDLFALVGALAWIGDQPSLVSRADCLFRLIASGSGAQSNCGGRAIKGRFRRTFAETGAAHRRTFRETGRTIGETDARSSGSTRAM